jgi:hypothetical protein
MNTSRGLFPTKSEASSNLIRPHGVSDRRAEVHSFAPPFGPFWD